MYILAKSVSILLSSLSKIKVLSSPIRISLTQDQVNSHLASRLDHINSKSSCLKSWDFGIEIGLENI